MYDKATCHINNTYSAPKKNTPERAQYDTVIAHIKAYLLLYPMNCSNPSECNIKIMAASILKTIPSPVTRQLMYMVYSLGYKMKEAAEKLQMDRKTVERRIKRCFAYLYQKLRGWLLC